MFRQVSRATVRNVARGAALRSLVRATPKRFNSTQPQKEGGSNVGLILGVGALVGAGYWWYSKDKKGKVHERAIPIKDADGNTIGHVQEFWSLAPDADLVWNEIFDQAEGILGKQQAQDLRKKVEVASNYVQSQATEAGKQAKEVAQKGSEKAQQQAKALAKNGFDTYNEIFDQVEGILTPDQAKDLQSKVNQAAAAATAHFAKYSKSTAEQSKKFWDFVAGTQKDTYNELFDSAEGILGKREAADLKTKFDSAAETVKKAVLPKEKVRSKFTDYDAFTELFEGVEGFLSPSQANDAKSKFLDYSKTKKQERRAYLNSPKAVQLEKDFEVSEIIAEE